MATSKPALLDTGVAAADLSGSQHHFVNKTTDTDINLAGAGTLGFPLQDKPESGESGTFVVSGKAKAVAGAAIAVMDKVMVSAASRGIVATNDNGVVGIALTAAAADGDIFEILVVPSHFRTGA